MKRGGERFQDQGLRVSKGMAADGSGMVWVHGGLFSITRAPSIMGQGAMVWIPKMNK